MPDYPDPTTPLARPINPRDLTLSEMRACIEVATQLIDQHAAGPTTEGTNAHPASRPTGSTPARDGEGSDTPAALIDRLLLKLGLARRSTVIKAYVNAQNNPTHDPMGCGCALDMLNHTTPTRCCGWSR